MKPQAVSFLSQKKIKEYHHFTTVSRETGHKKKKKGFFLILDQNSSGRFSQIHIRRKKTKLKH